MKASLLFLLFAVVAAVYAQTRPTITDQFYSEVHVAINDNSRYIVGGGILSFDVPKGLGRTDFKLENSNHDIETIHVLERYDLGDIYEIVDDSNCKTIKTTGQITDPFAWVAKATYNGSTSYRGRDHDVWVLSTTEDGGNQETKLFVDAQNVNIPAYLTTHNVTSNKEVYDTAITFLSFTPKEPEEWVFNIPHTCQSNLTSPLGCNSGSVVYWANANWNCGDISCSYRVAAGTGQPGYECAEFTARSLAAGGYVGLSTTAPQSSYANYKGYNLCYVSSLSGYCHAAGFAAKPASAASVQAGYAVMGNGGDGSWSHACIGVSAGHDDCHNNARVDYPSSGSFYLGVNAVWAPPGC